MRTGAGFVFEVDAPCAPAEALRRVLDLRVHDRIIPLTRVTPALGPEDLAEGVRFVARTSIGPVGFDDPMRIEALTFEPAAARIAKLGTALRGVVTIDVTPTGSGGSTVRWTQTVHLPWLPAVAQGLAARVLRAGYRRVLRRLVAEQPG